MESTTVVKPDWGDSTKEVIDSPNIDRARNEYVVVGWALFKAGNKWHEELVDPPIRFVKRGPTVSRPEDTQALERHSPISIGIAGRNRIICAISPKNLLPGVRAGPLLCAVILATG